MNDSQSDGMHRRPVKPATVQRGRPFSLFPFVLTCIYQCLTVVAMLGAGAMLAQNDVVNGGGLMTLGLVCAAGVVAMAFGPSGASNV